MPNPMTGRLAPLRALGQQQGQTQHRQGQQQDAADIQPARLLMARFAHPADGQGTGHQRQGQVHKEDPRPTADGDDGAADDRPEPQANAKHHPPGSKGPATLAPLAKLLGEDRHLGNQHRATGHALNATGGDQQSRVMGQPAEQRGATKGQDTQHKQALAAKAVGQCAGGHQHHGAGQGVGIHDPLQVRETSPQVLFKGRQYHRYAGDFQAEHQGGQADGGQGLVVTRI